MKMNNFTFNALYKNYESKGTPIKDDNKAAKKLRKNLSGKSLSQINIEFSEYILYLINNGWQYTQEEKNSISQETVDYYFLQSNQIQIPNMFLSALADFILDETLSNPSSNKVVADEYNILSFRQIEKRNISQVAVEASTLEYLCNMKNNNFAYKRNTHEKSDNK